MKKLLSIVLAITLLASTVGCGNNSASSGSAAAPSSTPSSAVAALTDSEKSEAEAIVKALGGALMLGKSWTDISGEDYKFDLSLTTFYCIMNPNAPAEIPAADYEAFIQKYFTVTPEALHEMGDYDKAKNVYVVSPDISVDRAVSQSSEVLKIDSVELQADGAVKVMYRSIWGKMASSGDGSDTAFAGNILLEKREGCYKIKAVKVTENNLDKNAG